MKFLKMTYIHAPVRFGFFVQIRSIQHLSSSQIYTKHPDKQLKQSLIFEI